MINFSTVPRYLCRNDAKYQSVPSGNGAETKSRYIPFTQKKRISTRGWKACSSKTINYPGNFWKQWDRGGFFFSRKPIPAISFEKGMAKKARRRMRRGRRKREWTSERGERKRSATLTQVLESSSYGQAASSTSSSPSASSPPRPACRRPTLYRF